MPATSHAYAPDPGDAREQQKEPAATLGDALSKRRRRPQQVRAHVPMALWREAAGIAAMDALYAAVAATRASWVYRQTLRGPVPDRIGVQPYDPRPYRLDEADAMFRGRFRLAGRLVDAQKGSIFDAPLDRAQIASVHGFDWLRHLAAAGGDPARGLAEKLAREWLAKNASYAKPGWRPEIIGARFLNLFTHGRFFLATADVLWRSKFYVSLRDQARVLSRTVDEAPDGLPRFQAAAALALAGISLGDPRNLAEGLAYLSLEITRQILPDGGHISRSPEALLDCFRALVMLDDSLPPPQREARSMLRAVLDRIAPMLRFFKMGDGALAAFHGGNESDARMISSLLAHDDAHGRPFGHAPHSGYQRLTAGKALLVMDAGLPPPANYSHQAHASCLAFEFSAGGERLIVNCGASPGNEPLGSALRATPAHSTLTLDDASSAQILPAGRLRGFLGPRLLPGPTRVDTRRGETDQGLIVEAGHDGYMRDFGIMHERRVGLALRGNRLTGIDRVIPVVPPRRRAEPVPFVIRFHIHPDVRTSLAQGGGSVILKLASGDGWRFRASGGGAIAIEPSVYFAGGALRKCEQLVISGQVKDAAVERAWVLEQVGPV